MKTTLLTVLCGAAMIASGCATSHSNSRAWEYKVVSGYIAGGLQSAINKAAEDGWVLVSSSGTGNTSDAYAVMKRVKK
jgi:hypothetical protein